MRPPLPCRPSKLRFDVDAQRSPRRQLVGVHAQAHRAAGVAPLGARVGEDLVQALGLGLRAGPGRSRGRPASARRRRPGGRAGSRPRRAGPRSGRWCRSRGRRCRRRSRASACPAVSPMYSRALRGSCLVGRIGVVLGVGHRRRQRDALARVGAPGDERAQLAGVDDDLGVELRVVVGGQRPPVGDGIVPVLPGRRLRRGPRRRRTSSRPGRPCRRGHRPRSTCCRSSSGPPCTSARIASPRYSRT